MNKNSNLHAIGTLSISTNEVESLGLVKRYEIFAASPVSQGSFCCTVVITSLVHLEDIVLCLLVTKSYIDKKKVNSSTTNENRVFIFLAKLERIE